MANTDQRNRGGAAARRKNKPKRQRKPGSGPPKENQNAVKHAAYHSALLPGEEDLYRQYEQQVTTLVPEMTMIRVMMWRAATWQAKRHMAVLAGDPEGHMEIGETRVVQIPTGRKKKNGVEIIKTEKVTLFKPNRLDRQFNNLARLLVDFAVANQELGGQGDPEMVARRVREFMAETADPFVGVPPPAQNGHDQEGSA